MKYNENISYLYIYGVFEYRLKQDGEDESEQNIIHVMDDTTRIAQRRIGERYNDDIGYEITYILDDHLGSSNARLDDTGNIIDRQEYYPFGDTSLRTFSKKRYQYIGREKDAESGLHYWSARYYSSWTCRFISVDKMASSYAHLTPYNYADNDPINDFDIDGNQNNNTQQTPSGGNSGGNGNSGGQTSTVTTESNESVSYSFEGAQQVLSSLKDKINLIDFKSFKFEKLPAMESKMDTLKLVDTPLIDNIKPKSAKTSNEWHPPLAAPTVENVEAVIDYSFEKFVDTIAGNFVRNPDFNVDVAVKTLNGNASSKSLSRCAKYVRLAINAGGVKTPKNPISAKDYKGYLDNLGFKKVSTENYEAQKGDIAVIQPAKGGSKHGHIQMYNGKQWVSDFKQNGFWPGSSYRKSKPSYTIYR